MFGRLPEGGKAGLAGLGGGVSGAVVANNLFPSVIEPLPGVKIEQKLTGEDGLHIDLLGGGLHAPNVDTPLPWLDGISAKILEINPSAGVGEFDSQYASLLSNVDGLVTQPAAQELAIHIAQGAAIGAAAGVLVSWSMARTRARQQESGETKPKPSLKRRTTALLVGAAILPAALLGAGNDSKDGPRAESSPLTPLITDLVPEFQGATVEGLSGKLFNTAARKVVLYKRATDRNIALSTGNVSKAIAKFQSRQEAEAPDLGDVRLAVLSDTHCDKPFIDQTIATELQITNPDAVIITGDMQTNSGTMFYEKDCLDDLADMLHRVGDANDKFLPATVVLGNHDAKDRISTEREQASLESVDRDNSPAEILGMPVMGVTDPVVTIWEPTLPADPAERAELLAKTGEEFADKVCEYYEKTGVRPMVLAHEWELNAASIYRGCAWLALDGHKHYPSEIVENIMGANGQAGLHYRLGTASGIAAGFSPYQAPERDASFVVMDIDRTINPPSIKRMFSPTIRAYDFSAKVEKLKVPKQPQPWSTLGWLAGQVRVG